MGASREHKPPQPAGHSAMRPGIVCARSGGRKHRGSHCGTSLAAVSLWLLGATARFHGLYGWLLPDPPFPSQPWRRDLFMRKEDFFARTMHTPDDPARAELRAGLREMSKHLLPLHRALIESARSDYEASVAPVSGPGHLLQLLNEDAFFAWLKPLTSLIVDIDE